MAWRWVMDWAYLKETELEMMLWATSLDLETASKSVQLDFVSDLVLVKLRAFEWVRG